jgi:hypothetical protein
MEEIDVTAPHKSSQLADISCNLAQCRRGKYTSGSQIVLSGLANVRAHGKNVNFGDGTQTVGQSTLFTQHHNWIDKAQIKVTDEVEHRNLSSTEVCDVIKEKDSQPATARLRI